MTAEEAARLIRKEADALLRAGLAHFGDEWANGVEDCRDHLLAALRRPAEEDDGRLLD